MTIEELKRIAVHAKRSKDNVLLRLEITHHNKTRTLRRWYSYFLHIPNAKIDCFCPVCTGEALIVSPPIWLSRSR